MLEARVESELVRGVVKRKGMCVKMMPTVAGLPDRLVILPGGRLYLVELKRPDGSRSKIQKHQHLELARRGVQVSTLYTIEEVRRWLNERDNDEE